MSESFISTSGLFKVLTLRCVSSTVVSKAICLSVFKRRIYNHTHTTTTTLSVRFLKATPHSHCPSERFTILDPSTEASEQQKVVNRRILKLLRRD